MSVFDNWSKFIFEIIKKESDLARAMLKHKGELGNVRETLIQGILNRILPSTYEIGSGEVIDSNGNRSKQIDIVVSRRDFPSLLMPSGHRVYLIESVLATIEVKTTLNHDSLDEALENCASVSDLVPNVVAGARDEIAKKLNIKKSATGVYIHDDPLITARFNLHGKPVSYIFGFKGYKKNSLNDFATAISDWATERETRDALNMSSFPAVISAEGCFSMRNNPPYSNSKNVLCLTGKDNNPLRFLILHILYTLSRKIPIISDSDGIVPNLDIYLQQMKPPNFSNIGIGEAFNKTV